MLVQEIIYFEDNTGHAQLLERLTISQRKLREIYSDSNLGDLPETDMGRGNKHYLKLYFNTYVK